MEGDTLVIHPPISSTQLSTYFKAGKHLEMGPFWNRNPVRQYWKFINPIGDFRVMLRNQLELATTQLKSHLTKLEESPSLHKLLDLVDPHRLEPHRLKLLKSMSPEDLKKIISTWKTETENTQHIEGFENALASSVKSNRWVRFGPKHEVSPDIDSYQFGLVSVGNYHNIEVNLSKESEYHRYLNPVSEARPRPIFWIKP
jgi:hypothetical protein